MTNTTIFEIGNEYQNIISLIEQNNGEITDDLHEAYINSRDELNNKAKAYIYVIRNKENLISNIDAEIDRLKEMKKRTENEIDRIKNYLSMAVDTFGNFETGLHKISNRISKSVEVTDYNQLPKEYLKEKIEISADKTAIKKAIESGVNISGALLVTKSNLQIK
jgi:DNA repair exonuclease SbcCD ATPase subunit